MELEGDGISDVLLSWLHTKDELGYGPSLRMPDTIVYKFGQPVHWYFTSVSGKLKKKNKQNLANVRIEEVFNKRNSELVAYYMSEVAVQGRAEKVTAIEYFDRRGLHEFLYNRWKENDGILQHFVEPKGVHNAIIRAIWSPKVCLLERRVNSKQLYDQRYGLYERAVTYDGPEHFSIASPLRGTALPSQIQRLCENLVAHVTEVSFQKCCVARMVANFKVDSRGRIWFLWSDSIRLERNCGKSQGLPRICTPVDINRTIQLPADITLIDKPNHSQGELKPLNCMQCISCGKSATSDQFHQVRYQTIISHFERAVAAIVDKSQTSNYYSEPLIIEATGGVGFGKAKDCAEIPLGGAGIVIPPIIKQIHPKLSSAIYKRYRRDPLFMYKSTAVCENCYLVYAEFVSAPSPRTYNKLDYTTKAKTMTSTEEVLQKYSSTANVGPITHNRQTAKPLMPSIPAPIYSAPRVNTSRSYGSKNYSQGLSVGAIIHQRGGFSNCPHTQKITICMCAEESFFKDVSNAHLQTGHPLAHLATSFRSIQQHPPEGSVYQSSTAYTPGPYSSQPGLNKVFATKNVRDEKGNKRMQRDVLLKSSSKHHREFLLSTCVLGSLARAYHTCDRLREVETHASTPNVLRTWAHQAAKSTENNRNHHNPLSPASR